ncbi:MAG: hypothetical protein NC350_04680, partial [Corallococcus sp.]|nr:hypothetical protein [Corallococcus sp.]
FTEYKFGRATANFCARRKTLDIYSQYFVRKTGEYRRYFAVNPSENATTFTFKITASVKGGDYFSLDGAFCAGVGGANSHYVAFAVVKNNTLVPAVCKYRSCGGETELCISFEQNIAARASDSFTCVTLYASDIAELSQEIDSLTRVGYCRANIYEDEFAEGRLYSQKTNITSANNLYEGKSIESPRAVEANYTYRYGDAVSTFIDAAGNAATVLQGFVFGVGGDSLYLLSTGKIDKLNYGRFSLQTRGITYQSQSARVVIEHDKAKNYTISLNKKGKILWLMPFEEKSVVVRTTQGFDVLSKSRKFRITCDTVVESFTTNAIECNGERLRYKLSNDISAGQCLAICFASAETVKCSVCSLSPMPRSRPVISESLLSTYLNYVNGKNVFCIANRLIAADALTLAAVTYTNPDFVAQYLADGEMQDGYCKYYSANGKVVEYKDVFSLPLAAAYYATVTGDRKLLGEYLPQIKCAAFGEASGKQICVKALLLKKLVALNIDKVDTLIEYGNLKKQIVSDKHLYAYAQAIGAVEMNYPSIERLKDLCNATAVPKVWYYISQLENLYGVSICGNRLCVKPAGVKNGGFEQLKLTLGGKTVNVVFEKSASPCMFVDGVTCFQSVDISSLPDNCNVVARY